MIFSILLCDKSTVSILRNLGRIFLPINWFVGSKGSGFIMVYSKETNVYDTKKTNGDKNIYSFFINFHKEILWKIMKFAYQKSKCKHKYDLS